MLNAFCFPLPYPDAAEHGLVTKYGWTRDQVYFVAAWAVEGELNHLSYS